MAEKRSKPKSGEVEIVGSFHPKIKTTVFKKDRILYWLSVGAKATPRVHNLLIANKVIEGKKASVKVKKQAVKNETTVQAESRKTE